MPQVTAKAPMTHLPAAPNVVSNVSVPAGNASPRTIAATAPGNRSLTLAGVTVKIDPTMHSPQNVVDIINNANIGGVMASLDRNGQLQITGVANATGDTLLLQHLGLA